MPSVCVFLSERVSSIRGMCETIKQLYSESTQLCLLDYPESINCYIQVSLYNDTCICCFFHLSQSVYRVCET